MIDGFSAKVRTAQPPRARQAFLAIELVDRSDAVVVASVEHTRDEAARRQPVHALEKFAEFGLRIVEHGANLFLKAPGDGQGYGTPPPGPSCGANTTWEMPPRIDRL